MIDKTIIEKGFTLIEVMISMVILSIGFLGVTSMMTGSIGSNSSADTMTTAATLAADQIEYLMTLGYSDALLADNGPVGLEGMASIRNPLPPAVTRDSVDLIDTVTYPPDNQVTVTTTEVDYTIYWNVADDFPTNNTKTVNVIVVSNKRGVQKLVILSCIIPRII